MWTGFTGAPLVPWTERSARLKVSLKKVLPFIEAADHPEKFGPTSEFAFYFARRNTLNLFYPDNSILTRILIDQRVRVHCLRRVRQLSIFRVD